MAAGLADWSAGTARVGRGLRNGPGSGTDERRAPIAGAEFNPSSHDGLQHGTPAAGRHEPKRSSTPLAAIRNRSPAPRSAIHVATVCASLVASTSSLLARGHHALRPAPALLLRRLGLDRADVAVEQRLEARGTEVGV